MKKNFRKTLQHNKNSNLTPFPSHATFKKTDHRLSKDSPELLDQADTLAYILLQDPQLYKLFEVAFERAQADELIARFRTLLEIFGSELRKEAQSPAHEAVADLTRSRSAYVTERIKRIHESREEHMPESHTIEPARTEAMPEKFEQPCPENSKHDQANDIDPSIDGENNAHHEPGYGRASGVASDALKDFMVSSHVFTQLRNRFRRAVFPDPLMAVCATVSRAIGEIQGRTTIFINMRWEISQYFESELNFLEESDQRRHFLRPVFTTTGTASEAYADSAAEYMQWRWPGSDLKLLDYIEDLLKSRNTCKLKPFV